MAAPKTRLDFYTADELATRPQLLHALASFINVGFSARPKWGDPRFQNDGELLEMLGDVGFCAVLSHEDEDEIVATAAAVRWGTEGTSDFEIKTVVTAPNYWGKGYADQCVKAVEEALVARSKSLDGDGTAAVKLWITAAEDPNGPYWRRKGFEVVKSVIAPAGMWGSLHDFELITLMRPAAAESKKA